MQAHLLSLLLIACARLYAQNADSTQKAAPNADDPSQFITRFEVYNELQFYNGRSAYLNQSIFRAVVKLGKRFTTRVDLPYVVNTFESPANYQSAGLGDISLRLLGYQLFANPRSALTASIEMSFNTAESPLLGTGKNIIIPMLTYSVLVPRKKLLFSAALQQFNSVAGDEARNDLNFSKLQLIMIKYWSRKFWTVAAPEWFFDYKNQDVSMNLRFRLTTAPASRLNLWVTPSFGMFGDFVGRYSWSADVGGRYFLFRDPSAGRK